MKLGRLEYKWIVGSVFVLGLFMELLDITIVNVALPEGPEQALFDRIMIGKGS